MTPLFKTLSLCLLACLFAGSSAYAAGEVTGKEMLRKTQMRLADLGYYAGRFDGKMNRNTKSSIASFQRSNGLASTGKLDAKTYDVLLGMDYARQRRGIGQAPSMTVDNAWHFFGSRDLPTQYAPVRIDEERKGESQYRYTVVINGRSYVRADAQPEPMRVSDVYMLNGEEAVVMTAWRGEANCAYRNYLVVIKQSGVAEEPREISSCSAAARTTAVNQAVFVSFSPASNHGDWAAWDVWRYENQTLVRM